MAAISQVTVAASVRRLNVNLPEKVYDELRVLADSVGRNITDLIRLALGLVKVALEERRNGNRLYVGRTDGTILKELVLPE